MFRRIPTLLIGFVCTAAAVPALAQGLTEAQFESIRLSKIVTAVKLTEAINFDGRLDEPVWQQAEPATDFFQKLPDNGAPSSQRTEVRFAYDDENLYVGATCFEAEMDRLMIRDLREDFDFGRTDLVQLLIDSLHDGRSGFTFVVNAAGARRDTQVSNNGTTNQDWDGVWDAKVSHAADAWFIEYAIPFKTLRFSEVPDQEWGLNITRRIMHSNEEANWAPVPLRYNGTRAALAGTLRGLSEVRQGRNLKIKPFVIGLGTQVRTGADLRGARDADGGLDLKYSITPALTLDATYRTDFAQVEVDQQQVNLTRFNLFFPEKRDFFLENSGIFTFGSAQGRFNSNSENLVPFFSRRIGLGSAGTPIPIIGGGRVSGQVNNYDVGFLTMKTEGFGSTPSNNYVVGRLKRNVFAESWLGAIVTDRESSQPGDYNRVYGPDVHFQFNRLEIDSFVLRSDSPGRAGRNQARKFASVWRDDEVNFAAEYNLVEPNFNPEVGFLRRTDMAQYTADAAWNPLLRRSEAIRNLRFGANVDYYDDAGGRMETRVQEATTGIQFENGASANYTLSDTFDRLDAPFAIRPAVTISAGDYRYVRHSVTGGTSNNYWVAVSGSAGWGEFWNGTNESLGATLDLRPSYHLNLDLSYSRNQVTLPGGAFTTQLIGARVIYGFSPRAFVNAFIQYNADTHQVSSNLRFNFTHHPLSDIYVVYNDRRDSTGGQLLERAFIVKATNLFTF
jgi:hypothetical protein